MQDVKASRSATTTVTQRTVPLVIRVASGSKVRVTGDFTNWSQEGIAMKPQGNGRFAVNLKLAPGTYQYRLLADGEWANDLDAGDRVSNPFGTENAVLVVQ